MPHDVRVKIYTMQKDEGSTLWNWFHHYKNIFGCENLTILDNGSTDRYTVECLKYFQKLGCRVIEPFRFRTDFVDKGSLIATLAREDMKKQSFDLIIPVDTDEHLAVYTADTISTERDAIMAELALYAKSMSAMMIDASLMNVPDKPGWYVPDHDFIKTFLPTVPIHTIDQGYHFCRTSLEPDAYTLTRLTYFHHHNRPFDDYISRSKQKMLGRVDVEDKDALRSYTGAGSHLIPALLMSKEEYASKYDSYFQIYTNKSEPVRFRSPDGTITDWNAQNYLACNDDVRSDPWLGPLHHFIKRGYKEMRQITAPKTASYAPIPLDCAALNNPILMPVELLQA